MLKHSEYWLNRATLLNRFFAHPFGKGGHYIWVCIVYHTDYLSHKFRIGMHACLFQLLLGTLKITTTPKTLRAVDFCNSNNLFGL